DAFGDMFEELGTLSSCLGSEVDVSSYEYDANWKICIENTIDEYHAAFVHPTTFRQVLSGRFEYSYEGLFSKVEADVTAETRNSWTRLERHFGARPFKSETYFHYLLFPLTTLASTFGVTFSLQT